NVVPERGEPTTKTIRSVAKSGSPPGSRKPRWATRATVPPYSPACPSAPAARTALPVEAHPVPTSPEDYKRPDHSFERRPGEESADSGRFSLRRGCGVDHPAHLGGTTLADIAARLPRRQCRDPARRCGHPLE